MASNVLQICHAILQNAYREKLGIEFSTSIAEIGKGRQPVWRIVSDADLTSPTPAAAVGSAGLLLDPEIGLLSYLLPYDGKSNLRSQIKRALGLRSKLLVEQNATISKVENRDPFGSWRLVLCWLVDVGAKAKWIDEIMGVRKQTGFSEELSFDAIFFSGGDAKAEIENYGFPRLLLTTREVFKKQRVDDMTNWLSANQLVEDALVDFASSFHSPEQRELASEISKALDGFRNSLSVNNNGSEVPLEAQTMRSIRIRNFRNLRDIGFDFGPDRVSANIVHGPNGTGKSSLCEALSVSLFQSSFRYKSFSDKTREKDVTSVNRAAEYLGKYLTSVDSPQTEPRIALDGQPATLPHLVSSDKTEEADVAMSGTILTQDASLEFTRMPANELAARVLRGYSDLAERVQEFTDSRVDQANSSRQEFLRRLGITAAITKLDTAYERIARSEIDTTLPAFPQALVTWLEAVERITGAGSSLPQRWRAWGDNDSRGKLARQMGTSPEKIVRDIREWLQRFNELALGSDEVIKSVEVRVESIREELEQAPNRLKLWGQWLEKQAQLPRTTASRKATSLEKKLHDLQIKLSEVLEHGRSVGGHYDHLTQVEAYVRENWSKKHPNDCPTCGTNQSERGGILSVVESLRSKTAAERENLRQEYADLRKKVDEAQKQLGELGETKCPLTTEEQSKLTQTVRWLIPPTADLSQWITNKVQRDSLLNAIARVRQIPSAPASVNAESEAERLSQGLLSRFREANLTFEAPDNWKPVKAKLTETLAEIVKEHLPNTLEKLWCELVLNLTAAPWLLLERPRLDVVTKRGSQASTVRVKDRLARYILNQAENHTLGLAWFFTRYLTRSRFYHASLIMDDPAHELDQTSYRDLCRLWETLVRMHRVYSRPFRLIVMLNQESRALEAARATGGVLAVLDWERDQGNGITSISVVGEGFYAPQPITLFEQTGT